MNEPIEKPRDLDAYRDPYPEIASLIDAKIEQLLEESRTLLKSEQSYAYVVGSLKGEIKWALGRGDINILKDAFNVPRESGHEN